MTEQHTPELAAGAPAQDGGGAAAAPPRRRRASRPAAAPDAVVETPAATSSVEPAAQAATEAEPSAEAKPAKAKAARTRSTTSRTRTSAKTTTESGEPGTGEAAGDAPSPESSADAAQPARPTRRKRAARSTEQAESAEQADEPSAAAQDAAAATTEVAAPEKPARRRRAATRPVAAPEPEVALAAAEASVDEGAAEQPAEQATEHAAEQEPAEKKPARRRSRRAAAPVEPEPVVETPEDDEAPEDEELEDSASDATSTDETSTDATGTAAAETAAAAGQERVAPRLATTALLFQAPDPAQARPRRRRVTSSAGSPEEISQAARQALGDAESAEDEKGAATETPEGAGTEQADERPSRRRGRRGRGSAQRAEETPAGDEQDELVRVDEAETPADEPVEPDEGEDAQGDEQQDEQDGQPTQRRRRRRGGRGRRRPEAADRDDEGEAAADEPRDVPETGDEPDEQDEQDESGSSRRRRRRRRGARSGEGEAAEPRRRGSDEVTALRGSTRLEAKRQRRREGRDAGRRRQIITESEFLARRESVERSMIVRELSGRTQIAVLEDGVLVEHYVSNQQQASMVGNVYLGRVQNVLPSMEAAFVDVGKGRNAVLYAGEVNWDAAGLEGQPRRIEQALKSGDSVLVQVTKDPIGHKGARLTSQVTLAGRYLVYVPGGGMTGISRKLPDTERNRLKKILREIVPDSAGVIVRTAAEGASEDELRGDIARLQSQWEAIEKKSKTASAPALLQGEPDMAIRVVRDIFNDDFSSLVVQGDEAWSTISSYIDELAPDLARKISKYTGTGDVFAAHRIDEQLVKGMDRKVWLPSGGSLVIDRTEAMTVVDVNTGKFTGSGGTLEETVTRNNLEAAEEIVRQLRLRDIGGIIVIDFIDMVLESNRDLVLRRLVECLGRDRTKHQVAEVTSLGLVQMTRKRVGQGLVEAFSETCEHCHGRGFIVHSDPVEKNARPDSGAQQPAPSSDEPKRSRRKRGAKEPAPAAAHTPVPVLPQERSAVKATLATIAAAAAHAHELHDHHPSDEQGSPTDGGAALAADEQAGDAQAPAVEKPDAGHVPAVETAPEPAGAPAADEHEARAGHGQPTLDVLAELATLRGGAADREEHLELTPVDPSVFVTFDTDEPAADSEK